jgi:hypothetical protein
MVDYLFNSSGIIGQVIDAGTNTITGEILGTLLLILILLFVVSLMFGVPLEIFALIVLPLSIVFASYYASFHIITVCILVILALIVGRNFLFR